MDFDLLVFLLIILAPLLRRLFARKQPQRSKRTPAEVESASPGQADDPLGEALRQIREALGEPTQPVRPLPANPPPVTAEPDDGFRALGEFEHEAHGFGRENPLSEEVFEQRPAFQTRGSTDRIRRKALGEVDLTTPLEVKTAPDSSRSDLHRQLHDPKRARDAFVLKEILDAPRSRRRLR